MKAIARSRWNTESRGERLDSDREVLPFPTGGVLCIKTQQPSESTGATDALIGHLAASFNMVQARLDALQTVLNEDLEADLDAIAGHIGMANDWPPAAA